MLISLKNTVFLAVVSISAPALAQIDSARSGTLTAITPAIMPAPQSGTTVLYDQTDAATPPLGASAQQLFTSPSALDTQAADDIVIFHRSGWSINQINFVIATDNGKIPPAQAATVSIVADNMGLPNDSVVLCKANNVVPSFNAAGNAMSVVFSTPCQLPVGHFWIEMQAISDFNINGNFVWEARRTQSNNAAVWQNPGLAFPGGPACPNWATFDTCQIAANFIGHVVAPDLLFQVMGSTNDDVPPPTLPTLSPWATLLLIMLLGLCAALPRWGATR